jgi:hypothetical protein
MPVPKDVRRTIRALDHIVWCGQSVDRRVLNVWNEMMTDCTGNASDIRTGLLILLVAGVVI